MSREPTTRSFFARVAQAKPGFLHIQLRPVEMTYAALALAMAGVALVLSGLQPFVGIAAVFVALIGGSYAPIRSVVLNRETGELLVIKRQRAGAGLAPVEVTCKLEDVTGVEIARRSGSTAQVRTELIMQDGARVPIEPKYSRSVRKQEVLCEQIRGFLAAADE